MNIKAQAQSSSEGSALHNCTVHEASPDCNSRSTVWLGIDTLLLENPWGSSPFRTITQQASRGLGPWGGEEQMLDSEAETLVSSLLLTLLSMWP